MVVAMNVVNSKFWEGTDCQVPAQIAGEADPNSKARDFSEQLSTHPNNLRLRQGSLLYPIGYCGFTSCFASTSVLAISFNLVLCRSVATTYKVRST